MLSNIPLLLINIYNPMKLRDTMSDVIVYAFYSFIRL